MLRCQHAASARLAPSACQPRRPARASTVVVNATTSSNGSNSSNGSVRTVSIARDTDLVNVHGTEIVMRPLGQTSAPVTNGSNGSNGAVNGSRVNGKATSRNGTSTNGAVHTSNGNSNGAARLPALSTNAGEQQRQQQQQRQGQGNGNGSVVLARQRVEVLPAVQSAAGSIADSGMLAGRAPAYYFEEEGNPFPSDSDFEWSQESYSKTKRTARIWTFVLGLRLQLFLLDKKWAYPGGMTEERRKARTRSLAAWVREGVLQLGPTFIKLGQLFSTRSDLFPAEFVEELSKLQDRVPAFSADKAVAIIERELGAPVDKLFRTFDRRPIAAASLGQVHRATLVDGRQVVVKVQRPGLKQLFEIDLQNLGVIARQLDAQDESGNSDFAGIYDECARILLLEIDYINEGRNADRFRRNFRDTEWVQVPRVEWQYSSPSVMTMEYMPGIKITNIEALRSSNLDARTVARRATESYLIQILRHGFFHADPHPGNIAVDASNGALIFYDFGMMGDIVPATRERLLDTFYALYRKDAPALADALTKLGVLAPSSDTLSVRRALQFFMDNIAKEVERGDAVSTIGEDLFAIAVDQPFRFPSAFTFVLRAFSTLEGIGKALDPEYQFVAVATPYAQELLDIQSERVVLLEELRRQATEYGGAAASMPLRVAHIDSVLSMVENGDLKLRVRVLEAERSARRAGVLQLATLHSVGAVGLLDAGLQLSLSGKTLPAVLCLGASAAFAVLVGLGFRRVQRLDKFERDVRSGISGGSSMG